MTEPYEEWDKPELIKELVKLKKRKRYGIVWEEKSELVVDMCREKLPVLEEDIEKSFSLEGARAVNVIIEGDNFHALSVLNYTHHGKIDVIYIDPPYNTGNGDTFRYNDNIVDIEDGYRNSKWLSFMNHRLKLAQELLTEKGVIIVSIDDNEVAQLKLLMNDIFHEENFIAQLVWKKKSGGGSDTKYFATDHEYILIYAKYEKNQPRYFTALNARLKADYKFKDDNFEARGPHKRKNLYQSGIDTDRPNLRYKIVAPDGKEIWPPTIWRWSEERFQRALQEGKIDFVKDPKGNWQVYTKMYLFDDEGGEYRIKPRSILTEYGTNRDGGTELKEIFGERVFAYPKPTTLIEWLISIILESAKVREGVVLDFFAGSGTTAHSVLKLNKNNSTNHKFILSTNNDGKICTSVCYPRVKNIMQGYKKDNGENVEGFGGALKYFKTDFVDADITDINMKKLIQRSTEMLCLKEDCFHRIKTHLFYSIFTNDKGKYFGIVYDDEGIKPLRKEILSLNERMNVYIFSLDESAREEEFEDIAALVDLKPIPSAILNVYRRLFK